MRYLEVAEEWRIELNLFPSSAVFEAARYPSSRALFLYVCFFKNKVHNVEVLVELYIECLEQCLPN